MEDLFPEDLARERVDRVEVREVDFPQRHALYSGPDTGPEDLI